MLEKREKTIFESIIARDLPATIIYEDERVIAFLDIFPQAPGHFLVVPKRFSTNLIDIEEDDFLYLISTARRLAKEEIKRLGVSGFRLIVNSGSKAKQVIFHTHIHIVPAKE